MGYISEVDRDPFFLLVPHRIAVHLDNDERDLGFSQHLRQVTSINPIAGDDGMVPQTNGRLLNKARRSRPVMKALNGFCAASDPGCDFYQKRRQQQCEHRYREK